MRPGTHGARRRDSGISVLLAFLLHMATSPWALAASPIVVGGQQGWQHDPGFRGGSFHTFDAFRPEGTQAPAHKVHVFLPRGYAQSNARYPVVYVNDGDTTFFPDGALRKNWRLHEALERLAERGPDSRLIAVAIVPVNRNEEYTHAPVAGRSGCCGLEAYATFITGPVKTFIDTHYRTRPDVQNTFTLGASHGGLAAFFTAARYPDRVGGAVAMSSSFWVGLDSLLGGGLPFPSSLRGSTLVRMLDTSLRRAEVLPRMYLDWGLVRTGGPHNSIIEALATARGREMASLLREDYGFDADTLKTVEDAAGAHDEDSWARRVEAAFAFLLSRRALP